MTSVGTDRSLRPASPHNNSFALSPSTSPSPASSATGSRRVVSSSAAAARRTALREFYALGSDRFSAGVPPSDIDRPDFNANVWLDRFVRENSAQEVIAKENSLMHEIRTLDGEGKALVYDNYSKLITAIETIQSMRGNMDPLQPTTSALAPAVAHIAEVSASLIATLSENRREDSSSEQEQEMRRQEVKLIVESPKRLRDLVNDGNVYEAKKQWTALEPVLYQLSNVKGIEQVRSQCLEALEGVL
ncbi:Vps51/Vps67-domain-containing protein [Kockiozyma suomiensis]|uniref:Vps51/Vps67-domain-containing protein n=1 Tax=Kockiozyma suomiensis TaxID=1337062 RepID=UPI00334434E7